MLKILKSISFSGASIVIAIIDSKMFPSNTTVCHLLVYSIMNLYYDLMVRKIYELKEVLIVTFEVSRYCHYWYQGSYS